MKGEVVCRRGYHALICDGWEYYDRVEQRGVGDKGKPHTTTRHIGTFFKDADAFAAWIDYLKSQGVAK